MNTIIAENFMRSAKAPTISAGVMMANVNWNIWKTDSGIVPERVSTSTPDRNSLPEPMTLFSAPPSPKASP